MKCIACNGTGTVPRKSLFPLAILSMFIGVGMLVFFGMEWASGGNGWLDAIVGAFFVALGSACFYFEGEMSRGDEK